MTFPVNLPMSLGPLLGIVGEVYRSQKDRRGDPINGPTVSEGNHVGTISGVIVGGQSARSRDGREERSDTSGQLGCPRDGIKLEPGDRVVIQSVVYSIVGPREFDYPSSLTGDVFPYYWVDVRAVVF